MEANNLLPIEHQELSNASLLTQISVLRGGRTPDGEIKQQQRGHFRNFESGGAGKFPEISVEEGPHFLATFTRGARGPVQRLTGPLLSKSMRAQTIFATIERLEGDIRDKLRSWMEEHKQYEESAAAW
jgi:hypothetical protein